MRPGVIGAVPGLDNGLVVPVAVVGDGADEEESGRRLGVVVDVGVDALEDAVDPLDASAFSGLMRTRDPGDIGVDIGLGGIVDCGEKGAAGEAGGVGKEELSSIGVLPCARHHIATNFVEISKLTGW